MFQDLKSDIVEFHEQHNNILLACYTLREDSRECQFSDWRYLEPRTPSSPDSCMISESALLISGAYFEL